MFDFSRIVPDSTSTGAYLYCSKDIIEPRPLPVREPGLDVPCFVDYIHGNSRKSCFHVGDYVATFHGEQERAQLRVSRKPGDDWAQVWVARVDGITVQNGKVPSVTLTWTYSSNDLLELERMGQLDASVGNVKFNRWARVLSDHVSVVPASCLVAVLRLADRKSSKGNAFYLKNWVIEWDKDRYFAYA